MRYWISVKNPVKGVILRDFSPEGYCAQLAVACLLRSAARQMLRKLSMTPSIKGCRLEDK